VNSYVDPSTYTTWRQISQVPPPRAWEGKHILYHNFSEMQKNKRIQLGKYTGSMRSIQKCVKIDLFPIIGSTDFFPKRCRQSVRLLLRNSIFPHFIVVNMMLCCGPSCGLYEFNPNRASGAFLTLFLSRRPQLVNPLRTPSKLNLILPTSVQSF
jgi:hypothetical protein